MVGYCTLDMDGFWHNHHPHFYGHVMAKIHDPNMSILATEMWDNRIHRFFWELRHQNGHVRPGNWEYDWLPVDSERTNEPNWSSDSCLRPTDRVFSGSIARCYGPGSKDCAFRECNFQFLGIMSSPCHTHMGLWRQWLGGLAKKCSCSKLEKIILAYLVWPSVGSDTENDRQGSVFKDPARIERDLVAHRNPWRFDGFHQGIYIII